MSNSGFSFAICPSSVVQMRGLMAWGIINLHSGDFEAAEHKAQEARSLALAGGLGREIGEASALVGLVAHMQNRAPLSYSLKCASFGDAARAAQTRRLRAIGLDAVVLGAAAADHSS